MVEEYKNIIDSEIDEIHDSIQDGDFKGIKFSGLNPFGKGKISNMKESAPKIWNYLNEKNMILAYLIGMNAADCQAFYTEKRLARIQLEEHFHLT